MDKVTSLSRVSCLTLFNAFAVMKEEVEPVSKRTLNLSSLEVQLGTINVGSNCGVVTLECAN